jgi:hypothetical protein
MEEKKRIFLPFSGSLVKLSISVVGIVGSSSVNDKRLRSGKSNNETLLSIGDGGISVLIKTESSSSFELLLSSSSSSSIRTIDG